MIFGQNDKGVMALVPQSVATSATATARIDTIGYEYALIDVLLDTAATNPVVLKLGEGDTTSAFTDIPAFIGDDTSTGFTIPAADTSNGSNVRFNVDLKHRKRHLQVSLNPGATQVAAVNCILTRAKELPNTDAEQGYDEVVTG